MLLRHAAAGAGGETAEISTSVPWQLSFDERTRLRRGRLRKEALDAGALHQASLVDEQHLVAQPARLAEVVGGHHDLGARGIEGADHRLDLARGAGIEA